jgi:hypothetical protein
MSSTVTGLSKAFVEPSGSRTLTIEVSQKKSAVEPHFFPVTLRCFVRVCPGCRDETGSTTLSADACFSSFETHSLSILESW